MNNKSKILLSVLSFFVACALGYFGVDLVQSLVRNQAKNNKHTAVVAAKGPIHSGKISKKSGNGVTSPALDPSGIPSQTPSAPIEPSDGVPTNSDSTKIMSTSVKIVEVSSPEYDEGSELYVFDVTASGIGLTYVVTDEKGNVISSQDLPHIRVKGTSSGNYAIYVQDINGNKSEPYAVSGCYFKVKKITAEEFGRILNSRESDNAVKADFKNRVSPGCRFEFRDRNEEEGDAPASYSDIIMRLKYNTWSSVNVLSVSYDGMNRLSKVTIKVNY